MNEWLMVGIIAAICLVLSFFLEAVVIRLFKICSLGRAFVYALGVNFVSLLIIYLGWPLTGLFGMDTGSWFPLFPLLYLTSAGVEMLLLKAMARHQPWSLLLKVAVIMNLASFAVLFFVLNLL